jgi:hypothetical protein
MLEKTRPIVGRPLVIGRQNEHLARRIDFGDIIELYHELYPDGVPSLHYQRPDDTTAYVPASVDTTTGLVWRPTAIDTAHAGNGRVELRWAVGGHLVKSRLWDVVVEPSLVDDGESPEEHDYYDGEYVVTPSWAEQVLETDEKICRDDIHVLEIQASETLNDAGGLTLSI